MSSQKILLTINERSKHVPYPPSSSDGSENFGFRVLKGKADKIDSIAELKDNEALKKIVHTINEDASPFFSVGCEKSFNRSANSFWAKGYIEFAYNCARAVSDAAQYFPLFFHFNRFAQRFTESNNVQFWFELQPAFFKKIDSAGFTCCVWITTGGHSSQEESFDAWCSAVQTLDSFLASVKIGKQERIYGSKT